MGGFSFYLIWLLVTVREKILKEIMLRLSERRFLRASI
jgi:hypothetical protein